MSGVEVTENRCRYATKRTFGTRADARLGILDIRIRCELEGREFDTLYPYPCPDAPHWHLSSKAQGYALCRRCNQRVPAWKGWWWVIAKHDDANSRPCRGEGSRAADDTESKGRSCAGE